MSPTLAWLPNILFIPPHIYFIPPSKFSFVLLTTPFHIPFFSTIPFIFFQSKAYSSYPEDVVSLGVCLACASLRTRIASFTSSSHHFTAQLYTTNILHITSLAVVLTSCSHPFIIVALALSHFMSFLVVPILSISSETCTAFFAICCCNSCCFTTSSYIYALHLCTVSYRAYFR